MQDDFATENESENELQKHSLNDKLSEFTDSQLDTFVKEAITTNLKLFNKIKQTDTLVTTLYYVMKSMFVDKKDHVILSAPTGTGKSVIGYMINYCFIYITDRLNKPELTYGQFSSSYIPQHTKVKTYTLTSSKILQEQIDGDIDFFQMDNNLAILKGIRNYECTKLTKESGIYHNYSERFCSGMGGEERQQLQCYNSCPYISQRFKVSGINNAILNYAYFLSVLKSANNPFFGIRDLTICDESHLIPDIVSSHFNIDVNMNQTNKMLELYRSLDINFKSVLNGSISVSEFNPITGEPTLVQKSLNELLSTNLAKLFDFFTKPLGTGTQALVNFDENYWKPFVNISRAFSSLLNMMDKNKTFLEMYQKDFNKFVDFIEFNDYTEVLERLNDRPEDLFIESSEIGVVPYNGIDGINKDGRYKIYKHNIYDLSESEMCREHFLTKVKKAVYMSATLGNIDEFAVLMGLKIDEYAGFRLPSNFDFSTSPIYLTDSGYLNYKNFDTTIDKVLDDALFVCEHRHPNEKGIIHTSTFKIANLFKNKLVKSSNPSRYLFYDTSASKEECINKMKQNPDIPYVIIGPSLYEGIDLKDDLGRFNIILKAPYSGMSDYTQQKMLRYPFWYKRVVLEKIEQAIGRTNRHVKDRSVVYLMDSVLNKLVFELPEHITKRVSYNKI